MPNKDVIELLVEGGKAGPDPTSAQRLSAYKLNIGEVFKKVNEETESYKGMEVPVKIIVDKDTKEVEVEVGIPPVTSMIKKELGLEKAKIAEEDEETVVETVKKVGEAEKPKEEGGEETKVKTVLGDLSMEQCVKIAKMKIGQMLVKDLKSAVKQVVGTAGSMQGIQVEGKNYKEVLKDIEDGKWDKLFA